jgi:diguanylate cyclase (GGDEF)-like protein
MVDEIPDNTSDRNLASLLKTMAAVVLVSIIVIPALAGYGIHRIYSGHFIAEAEDNALQVGAAIIAEERDVLFPADPEEDMQPVPAGEILAAFDQRMRKRLEQPIGVLKVQIFSLDEKVVYSTEPLSIGRVEGPNPRLKKALLGYSNSMLEKDLPGHRGESSGEIDMVETYFPIRDGEGSILGSFGISTDVTKYRRASQTLLTFTVLCLLLAMLFVFGCAYFLVRKGDRRLRIMQDKLERLASTDYVTGTFNRRHLFARSREEFAKVLRGWEKGASDYSLGVIMIDLDHLKAINDQFGFVIGDGVLCETVNRIRGALRNYDIIGRFGGEEFLILLPETTSKNTRAVAERMRVAIRDREYLVGGRTLRMTASLGIACVAPDDEEASAAIRRAGQGVRQAQDGGGDRVEWMPGALAETADLQSMRI